MSGDAYDRIKEKISKGLFGDKLIDNGLRGTFAEYMCAEALGSGCKVVSGGWHAWDLELDAPSFGKVRIQVKNTAFTQTWHRNSRKLSDCKWILTLRNRPSYFVEYNPGVKCEDYGFLCDAFILCHHPVTDWSLADHRMVDQWDFYVVPVSPVHQLFPVVIPEGVQRKSKSYVVMPETLRKGIRGRHAVEPVKFSELTEVFVRRQLERPEFTASLRP